LRGQALCFYKGARSQIGAGARPLSESTSREFAAIRTCRPGGRLENNEAGIEYLAQFENVSGVVTVHHHLAVAARRLGLLSIVRLFLSDSRAVDRGVSVVKKSRPDAIEILPAAVAANVASDFADLHIPRIAGGLCRTEADVNVVLASGCRAVTSTSPTLWKLNPA